MRGEGGQVIDSKPVMFGRPDLEWSLLAPFGKDALSQSVSIACEHLEGCACTKSEEEPEEPNEGKTILNKEKFQPVGCVKVF